MKKIIVLLVALMVANLSATVRYVKHPGDSPNSWTGRSPVYTSINAAVKACQSGDEVWIAEGHFYEWNIKVKGGTKLYGGFDGVENSLSERGNPWNDIEKTTIDGNNNWTCIVISLGNDVTVDGFNIIRGHEGTGSYDRGGGVRVWNRTDVILRNLNIHDCYAAQGAGILIDTEQNFGSITIEKVIIYDCDATCGALEVANPTRPIVNIQNCTIANNAAFGLEWAGSAVPYRMDHIWQENILWNNNNPRTNDIQENLWNWGRTFSINTYVGGARWTDYTYGAPGEGVIFGDEEGGPGFESGSFQLTSNSPCPNWGALPYTGPVVPDPAELSVNPTTLNIGTGNQGLFTVSNIGDELLTWQASENETWMSLSPVSGSLAGGHSQQVTVTINRENLEQGNYSGNVLVASNGGNATIIVNMSVVAAAPVLNVNPTMLSFDENTSVRNVSISNSGTANLTWASYENPERSWILSLDPNSGSLAPGQNENMTVTVDNTIPDGTYQGMIIVSSNGGNENIAIEMILESSPPPPEADYLVRVNCGSDTAFIDADGYEWQKDKRFTWGWGYVDGYDYYSLEQINNTVNDGLFQTNRIDPTEYKFDGSNGHYVIKLLFAEIKFNEEWQSRFDVYIENELKISNLDLFDFYGKYYATERMFEVDVTDGMLNIGFADRHPQVSAIEVKGYYSLAKSKIEIQTNERIGVIWPNPFRYKVEVREPDLKTLTVFNILGQKILETEKNECIMNNRPAGIYFFMVETMDGNIYALKGLYMR